MLAPRSGALGPAALPGCRRRPQVRTLGWAWTTICPGPNFPASTTIATRLQCHSRSTSWRHPAHAPIRLPWRIWPTRSSVSSRSGRWDPWTNWRQASYSPTGTPSTRRISWLSPTEIAGAGAGWILAVMEGDGEPMVRTLGFGAPSSSSEVASFSLEPTEHPGVLMELRGVLSQVARIRHDLNNPLTSALAESASADAGPHRVDLPHETPPRLGAPRIMRCAGVCRLRTCLYVLLAQARAGARVRAPPGPRETTNCG